MTKTLFDLQREANELEVRLAHVKAAIRRHEHEIWRAFQQQRYDFLQGGEEGSRELNAHKAARASAGY